MCRRAQANQSTKQKLCLGAGVPGIGETTEKQELTTLLLSRLIDFSNTFSLVLLKRRNVQKTKTMCNGLRVALVSVIVFVAWPSELIGDGGGAIPLHPGVVEVAGVSYCSDNWQLSSMHPTV